MSEIKNFAGFGMKNNFPPVMVDYYNCCKLNGAKRKLRTLITCKAISN